ncbi:ribosomal L29 protein-domain-containing protein [Syncephalis pseudoplumigaleata]|uniref:Ribosomal L29 protein-domain-containing protein n=1 Tax=Syncephalis pseudoplumigaleata TaxID=1712513 RepID=A0A4V1J119_9FUNG|nr:ribosomal L29 protein-domain-containing protein [Syncephalis pseudoplumigaleata]|eukprot:RKP23519.1 ribosomal L29 protein-domain-containing protein [Syncephalis pseudoplumigaleata]
MIVKASELRQKDRAALEKQLEDLKQELLGLRVQKVTAGNNAKTFRIREVKHAIARTLTVITQKQRAQVALHYKGKKYKPLDLRTKKTRAIRRQLTKKERGLKTLRTIKREQNFPQRKYALKA